MMKRNKFKIGLAICVLLAGAYFAKPIVAGIGDVIAYVNEAGTEVFSIDQDGKCTVTSFETSTVDINGGAIDGTTIGAASASTGAFTTLTASGVTSVTDATEASATTTASLKTAGGLGVAKKSFFGTEATFLGNAAAVTFGNVLTDADVVLAFDAVTAQGSITYMEDEDRFDFDNDVDVIGDLTAATVASDAGVSGVDADFSGDVYLDTTKKVIFADDADDHTHISESSADVLNVTVGGVSAVNITESSTISGSLIGAWDVTGDFTAGTMTSDAGVGGTIITASTGFALGDGDYVGVIDNERLTFATGGTIAAVGANFDIGTTSADDVQPALAIRGDADSDAAGDTDEAFTIDLTPHATPTSAIWDITSTQSAGYRYDKSVTVGLATPDETTPTFAVRGDADSDAEDTTDELALVLTANATPTSARWGFTSTQSAGYSFDKNIIATGGIDGAVGANTPSTGVFTILSGSSSVAVPEKTPVNAIASVGKITSDATSPSDTDTVTIDTKVYTFKTVLTPTEGEVLIGGSAAIALDNLKHAINHTGTPDTDYKCAAVHPTVTATTNGDTTQLVAAKTKGVAGDLIALAEASTHLTVDAATLGTEVAGVDGTVGVVNEVAADASYLYHCTAVNTIADDNWRRISLGSAY